MILLCQQKDAMAKPVAEKTTFHHPNGTSVTLLCQLICITHALEENFLGTPMGMVYLATIRT